MTSLRKQVTVGLLISLSCTLSKASTVSPYCQFNQICLFNQEAEASDPAGIRKYSEALAGTVVPTDLAGNNSFHRIANHLADRLAKAEQMARTGNGKLVSEEALVKAFNDLMQEIGAPPSMRASEATVHSFRKHAAAIKAFPALFSANRNGTNCDPGEAVFLIFYMAQYNGQLPKGNLDSALIEQGQQRTQNGGVTGASSGSIEPLNLNGSGLLFWYSTHHDPDATKTLVNHMAGTLGI